MISSIGSIFVFCQQHFFEFFRYYLLNTCVNCKFSSDLQQIAEICPLIYQNVMVNLYIYGNTYQSKATGSNHNGMYAC